MSVKDEDFQDLMAIAGEFLEAVSAELDPYTENKGFVEVGETKAILLTPSHIQFAKYGRGPGKKPPLDNILEWVKKEGITFEKLSDRGTAFAIQASIGKNGTQNWVPNAPNALEEAIRNHMEEYSDKMGKAIAIKINDQVNGIYKQINFKNIM
jgi:hypothetical protein